MIEVAQFFDTHFHGRDDAMLTNVIKHLGQQCCAVLFMPNLDRQAGAQADGLLTAEHALAYQTRIKQAGFTNKIILTIKITPQTTPEIIRAAWDAGIIAAKLYPDGVTTGSEGGIKDFAALDPVYAEMEQLGMHLLLHGEQPGICVLDAEAYFLHELYRVGGKFSKLKVTLEHITTADACRTIQGASRNFSATITIHHLLLTIDDVVGPKIQPHNFCKPLAKREHDRQALLEAAFSGNPKFRFGSDSAPHLQGAKECASGCAGVYTAPIMVPLLCQIFTDHGQLGKLRDFTFTFGQQWFGLELQPQTLELTERPWQVPAEFNGVVPFWAGKELRYKLV